ncbi:MAG: hypothetical protein V8S72_01145 [Oscillospiraceae bacterium]
MGKTPLRSLSGSPLAARPRWTNSSCGELNRDTVAVLLKTRRVFPCFFGSGLRTEGVEEFMQAIDEYAIPTEAGDVFSARVYKIARDAQGTRPSFLRVNGAELSVRQLIGDAGEDGAEHEEKINQLRIYSGINMRPLIRRSPAGSPRRARPERDFPRSGTGRGGGRLGGAGAGART